MNFFIIARVPVVVPGHSSFIHQKAPYGAFCHVALSFNSSAIQLESAALQLLLTVAERHMSKGNDV